ncbi:MAG: NHLP bacteriocin export ABC transporter permease/ATPase subunit [Rhodobacteraceae bacterium]|nr:NHLP bacteriocin export ABC transporter permease/ATPase subunit [Paracoccaceae bacterium]
MPPAITLKPETAPEGATVLLGGVSEASRWPACAWYVEDGAVDVFATYRASSGRRPNRVFLFTAEKGGFLLGQGQFVPGHGLLGVSMHPREGARLSLLDMSGLERLRKIKAPHAALRAQFFDGIDSWFAGLASACDRIRQSGDENSAPGDHRIDAADRGKAGAERRVARGERIAGGSEIVWATASRDALWLGTQVAAETPVPLALHMELEARETMTVRSCTAADALGGGDLADTLSRTCDALFASLVRAFDQRMAAEAQRFARKQAQAESDRSGAFGKLAKLLAAPERAPEAIAGDSLTAAFIRLCQHERLDMPQGDAPARTDSNESRKARLDALAAKQNLRMRPVILRGTWWRSDSGPLIGFMRDSGDAVALVSRPNRQGYDMISAAAGTRRRVTQALARELENGAFSAHPGLPTRPLSYGDVGRFAWRAVRREVMPLLAWCALAGLSVLVVPLATGAVIDAAIPNADHRLLTTLGMAMLFVAAANLLFSATKEVAILRIGGLVSATLQPAIVDRLLQLAPSFFRDHPAGDLALRVTMVSTIVKTLANGMIGSILSSVFSLYGLVLVFVFQPMLGALLVVLIALLLGVAAYAAWRKRKEILEGEATGGLLQAYLFEVIAGIQRVRLSAAENAMFGEMVTRFAGMRDRLVRAEKVQNLFDSFLAAFDLLSLAVLFLVVASMAEASLSMGVLLLIVTAFSITLMSFQSLARIIVPLYSLTVLAERARPVFDATPEVDAQKAEPGRLAGRIEINKVVFSYGENLPRALDGVSVEAGEGQFVALVGASGCGKSTLLKLILGFEKPAQGSIFFDGHDLAGLDLKAVRQQIGTVLQTDRLVAGSIYDNIRGASDASLSACWNAARLAGIDRDIKAMPMQMHTVIAEAGASLSGGQVQRLLIARALSGKPRILLFDEATSALDEVTQAQIAEDLKRLPITRLAIAHRLSTIRDADRIYVMDAGRIVESGTHDALVQRKGLYRRFQNRQAIASTGNKGSG